MAIRRQMVSPRSIESVNTPLRYDSRNGNMDVPQASATTDGYLSKEDFATFSAKVSGARSIATTSPLTGGGDLSVDRTHVLDFTVSWTWTANGIGATPTDRIVLSNTTAAISGTQQYSPALRLIGQGWGTTAGTSQATDWRIYNQPVQGTVPTSNLLIDSSIAGGAFSTRLTIGSSGVGVTAAGSFTSSANITCGSSSGFVVSGKSHIKSSTDGLLELFNNAASGFTRLNFGGTSSSFPALARSSATLKCRLADDSADAAFTALSFQSANPSGGTAAAWKFGSKITAAVTADTTRYLEVDVAGTAYKVIIST